MASAVPVDDALAMWADFPVNKSPRPLVLTENDIIDPRGGFRNTDLKNAYCDGNFVAPDPFPSSPSSAAGYPILSAHDAFEALRTAGDGQRLSDTTLAVTAMELGSATFTLDRGPRVLPAWLISLQDIEHAAVVLAVRPSARFMPPNIPHPRRVRAARIAAEDTTLTVKVHWRTARNQRLRRTDRRVTRRGRGPHRGNASTDRPAPSRWLLA